MTADYNTCTTCVNLKLQLVCYFNERILHVITCLHVYSLSCILLWRLNSVFCFFFSANLSPYYVPKKIGSMPPGDFICSKESESGMRYCSGLPRFEYEGIKCNASARLYSNNTPTNDSCVNWNQYYTNCTAGDKNPFQGGVSFDNIGLAWVAIFQVWLKGKVGNWW